MEAPRIRIKKSQESLAMEESERERLSGQLRKLCVWKMDEMIMNEDHDDDEMR